MKILHSKILGSGRPLIVLHGFLGMSDNWKSLGLQYANAGFEVHLVDQRNHGKSFWSDEFNYSVLAEDLLNYLNHHQIYKTAILGHSMGGKTAMFFTCIYPDRVDRLVVADIGIKYYPPHHREILDALTSLTPEDLTSRNAADLALTKRIKEWGIRQFLLKNLYWKTPDILGFRMNLNVLSQSMEKIGAALPEQARYDGPVLFIRGGKSAYILDEDIEGIHTHFPNATLQTLPETGHWLHAEDPERFFEISMTLLQS